ncbi:unnamed protein product [Colias eurytheme]|nr:unnamed protein product [Colias eurytheme]
MTAPNNDLKKMFRTIIICALSYQVVASESLPAVTTAPVPIPIAGANTPGVNPYVAGLNNAYPGYNGYRSPYYNPASATAPILSYSNNRAIDGSYSYSYATGDGKQAQERGFLKDAFIDNHGSPQGTQVLEGSYAYTSPEGIPIQVSYVADENGFRPAGVHIPADGRASPAALPAGYNNNIYDPRYNGYNPINYRNPYNNQYNPLRPYDSTYNQYHPYAGNIANGYKKAL